MFLFGYSLEFNEWTHRGNYHPFDDFHSTGKSRADVLFALAGRVIPNLAVGAVAVPTKIPVRDSLKRKKLKAAEYAVVFRYFNALSQHFYGNQSLIGIEQVVLEQ